MFFKNYNDYYRIVAFGPTGVGKSQFCNFCQNDLDNSINEVSDSLSSCTIQPQSNIFKRSGINIELIDTAGNNDTKSKDYENLQKVCDFLRPKQQIDYIILLLNFQTRLDDNTRDYIKILGNIFTPQEFYTHFCVVFTHLPEKENKKIKEKKTKYIEEISKIINEIFCLKDTTYLPEVKVYFLNTEINEDDYENKSFDYKSQKTVDVILEDIKINVNKFPPIDTQNLEVTGKSAKLRNAELEEKVKKFMEEQKREEQRRIQIEQEGNRLKKELQMLKKNDAERERKDRELKEYQRKQEEIRRKQNEELKRIEEMNKEIQKREELVNKMCKENKIEVERLNRAIKAGKVMAIGGGIGCGVGFASLFAGGLLALSCPALTIPYLFYIGFVCIPSGIALAGSGAVVSTVSGVIKYAKEKD